jgi:RNA polymerase sigma factor (sigma-70 family)
MMTADSQLLGRYLREKSQDAFTELVQRHLNLVYSAALRQARSPQLAEEISQSVFTDLARDAHKLKPDTVLTAWLYQVARRTAIDVVRRESRRQARERLAVEMAAMNTASDWTQIEPLLDEAMDALEETDRAAVLLRYFDNKSLREVGQALGTSDDAAQKRVSRAVERLRDFLSKRGVAIGAAGLVVLISANAVQAAPVGLAIAISSAALVAATTIQTSTAIAATKAIAMTTLQKVCIASTIAVLAGTGIYEARQSEQLQTQLRALQDQQAPLTEQIAQLKQERDDASNRMAALTEELATARGDNSELLRLRGEVSALHEQLSASQNSQNAHSLAGSEKIKVSADPASTDLATQLAAAIVQGDPTAMQRMRDLANSRFAFFNTNRIGLTNEQLAAIHMEAFGGLASAFDWLSQQAAGGNTNARQAFDQAARIKELQGFAVRGLGQLAGKGDENALQMLLNPDRYGLLLSSTVSALAPAAENGNAQAIAVLAAVLQDPTKKPLWQMASLGLQGPAASGNTIAIEALKSMSSQQATPPPSAP